MFGRSASAGFTSQQQAMLARYEALVRDQDGLKLKDMMALDDEGKRRIAGLAAAIDQYGTPDQRAHFIDVHRMITTNFCTISLQDTPKENWSDIRTVLCREAVEGWPSVRGLHEYAPFAKAAQFGGEEGFQEGVFIRPDGSYWPVSVMVWLSAFGGPTPMPMIEMVKEHLTCVEAYEWLESALKHFNYHVNEIMLATHTHGYR